MCGKWGLHSYLRTWVLVPSLSLLVGMSAYNLPTMDVSFLNWNWNDTGIYMVAS